METPEAAEEPGGGATDGEGNDEHEWERVLRRRERDGEAEASANEREGGAAVR